MLTQNTQFNMYIFGLWLFKWKYSMYNNFMMGFVVTFNLFASNIDNLDKVISIHNIYTQKNLSEIFSLKFVLIIIILKYKKF